MPSRQEDHRLLYGGRLRMDPDEFPRRPERIYDDYLQAVRAGADLLAAPGA